MNILAIAVETRENDPKGQNAAGNKLTRPIDSCPPLILARQCE